MKGFFVLLKPFSLPVIGFAAFFFLSCAHATESPVLNGDETRIKILPAGEPLQLASYMEESRFYSPDYFDDHIIYVEEHPVVHFTLVSGQIIDFYFHLSHPDDLDSLSGLFEKHDAELAPHTEKFLLALLKYKNTRPEYTRADLHRKVGKIVKKLTNVTLEFGRSESLRREKLDAILFRYLQSNGISRLEEIENRPRILQMIVNKFYLLATTYFYRDWAHIKEFKKYLPPLVEKARKENRPVKLKIYGCSTGEEVMTYAIELLEEGIEDFRILASDINESCLEYAKNMKYAPASFERLPTKTLEKIKRYFKHDPELDLWEPKNPELFKSRIRFIRQDVLEELPADLDPEFAPPFELVSILNTLLYLDPDTIQKKKDIWKDALVPGGILVLKDAVYSLAKGALGKEWSFRHFIMLNEWINLRILSEVPDTMRLDVYEKKFQNPTELDLKLLTRGYLLTGKFNKTLDASREYLKKNPFSFQALTSLAYYYAKSRDPSRLEQTLRKLVLFHGDQRELLTILAGITETTFDRKFLEKLKSAYTRFLKTYHDNPGSALDSLDFKSSASSRWETLREIIRINCTNLLVRVLLTEKRFDLAEEMISSNLERIGTLSQKRPEALILSKLLANLAKNALPHYIDTGRFDAVHIFCNHARDILEYFDFETRYVYLHDCAGYLALQESRALILEKRSEQAKDLLFYAGEAYDRALKSLEMLPTMLQDELLRNAGLSYAWQGEIYRDNQENLLAKVYFNQALRLFERALEMDPLYSGDIAQERKKVLQFTNALPS